MKLLNSVFSFEVDEEEKEEQRKKREMDKSVDQKSQSIDGSKSQPQNEEDKYYNKVYRKVSSVELGNEPSQKVGELDSNPRIKRN